MQKVIELLHLDKKLLIGRLDYMYKIFLRIDEKGSKGEKEQWESEREVSN